MMIVRICTVFRLHLHSALSVLQRGEIVGGVVSWLKLLLQLIGVSEICL